MARAPAARAAPSIHCPRGQCAAGPTVPPIATLSSIYPHGGPTSGGTRLILRGHGFRDFRQALQCEFGALAEPATAWVEDADALTLNCTTPPRPIAERTRIRARLTLRVHNEQVPTLGKHQAFGVLRACGAGAQLVLRLCSTLLARHHTYAPAGASSP